MKYICKDCGKEYHKHVEYCVCGNNKFEIVEIEVKENIPTIKSGFEDEIPIRKPQDIGQIISWLIFSICMVLSLVIIFLPVKNHVNHQAANETTENVKHEIPDFEKIWDSTPVKVAEKPVQPEEQKKPETILDRVMANIEEPAFVKEIFKNETNKNTSTQQQNKSPQQTTKPVTKPAAKPVTTPAAPKPAAQTKPQTQQQKPAPATVQKPVTKPTQKPAASNNQTSTQKTQSKPTQNLSEVTLDNPVKQKVSTPKYDIKATTNYEAGLLRKLYSNFAVGGLSGTGTCIVSFIVDENGKLANRKFEQYSDNKALNDAVYFMMMKNPTYEAPPSGYYRRTLKVQVKYTNGEYTIGYI